MLTVSYLKMTQSGHNYLQLEPTRNPIIIAHAGTTHNYASAPFMVISLNLDTNEPYELTNLRKLSQSEGVSTLSVGYNPIYNQFFIRGLSIEKQPLVSLPYCLSDLIKDNCGGLIDNIVVANIAWCGSSPGDALIHLEFI